MRFDPGTQPRQTADGRRVVYCQNAEQANQTELWSVPVVGGPPALVSSLPHDGSNPCNFELAAGGTTLVYRALVGAPPVFRLFAAPVDGSATPIELTPSLPTTASVTRFLVSPNGARVVYLADQETDEAFSLFSVPIAGGASVRLHPVAQQNGDVDASAIVIAPDSSRVAFRGDLEADEVFELYSSPLAGGAPAVKLNGTLVAGGDVSIAVRIAPNSSRAVYVADQQTNDRFELYSVPLAGGAAIKLNGALVANGNVFGSFRIDPLSTTVVYVADQVVDLRTELFAAPLAGGAFVQLSDPLVAGGDVEIEFLITPDGARAVYIADQIVDGRYELFGAPLGGGGATRINHVLPAFSSVQFDPLVTPDGQTAVYGVRYGAGLGAVDLFSATITGASPTPLFPTPVEPFWEALRPALAAGNAHVFYELRTDNVAAPATASTLLRAPLPGGTPVSVGPLIDYEAFERFHFFAPALDARQILFVHSTDGTVSELFVGDVCLLCDGFGSGGTGRWSGTTP